MKRLTCGEKAQGKGLRNTGKGVGVVISEREGLPVGGPQSSHVEAPIDEETPIFMSVLRLRRVRHRRYSPKVTQDVVKARI